METPNNLQEVPTLLRFERGVDDSPFAPHRLRRLRNRQTQTPKP
jgi:hypothetical protein